MHFSLWITVTDGVYMYAPFLRPNELKILTVPIIQALNECLLLE